MTPQPSSVRPRPVLVIGARGLLGNSLVRRLRLEGHRVLTARIPWATPGQESALQAAAARLIQESAGGTWTLVWCAGSGVTGARAETLDLELAALVAMLEALAPHGSRGLILLASSAGGVYAGSANPPHTELTESAPLSAYGEAKLAAEDRLREWAELTGGRGVAVRYANLYGPGQDLRKPQGLISHLCRGFLTAQPVSIYVPADTMRDYIYADDAAALTVALTRVGLPAGSFTTKICASGQSVTITGLVGTCGAVFRRRPKVVMGSSPLASAQARDLRLRSVVLPEVTPQPATTLVAGISQTLAGTRQRLFGTR